MIEIKKIIAVEEKQQIIRNILEDLQDWFELAEGREKYISESAWQTMIAAFDHEKTIGFCMLKETGKDTIEIYVMGVLKEYQRQGIGRKLFEAIRSFVASKGYSFIQVKTVQMGKYSEYDDTNRFYQSVGFKEFEVLTELWGEENPCQIYIMAV